QPANPSGPPTRLWLGVLTTAANNPVSGMEDGTLLLMYRSLYSLQFETCVTVHLWHLTRFPQEPAPYNPMNYNFLPTTWRLASMNTYRGTDAMHWRLLNHSQASVLLRLFPTVKPLVHFSGWLGSVT
uniref:Uncharacterized protein n=1 Tax=Mus spicilegus TaxID=10103 RepID=A0A8C6GA16_MUSSI